MNIEAQAAGCPVVASRVDGIPEYVIDGKSGLLFEPEDLDDLVMKMRLVLTHPDVRGKLIEGGFEHARNFDWQTLAPRYLSLYDKVIREYDGAKPFKPWSDLTQELWQRINLRNQ